MCESHISLPGTHSLVDASSCSQRNQGLVRADQSEIRFLYRRDGGEQSYLTLREIAGRFASMFCDGDIGGFVLEPDFTVRKITDAEKRKIRDLADEIEASK
jgi:hypothetical protein